MARTYWQNYFFLLNKLLRTFSLNYMCFCLIHACALIRETDEDESLALYLQEMYLHQDIARNMHAQQQTTENVHPPQGQSVRQNIETSSSGNNIDALTSTLFNISDAGRVFYPKPRWVISRTFFTFLLQVVHFITSYGCGT